MSSIKRIVRRNTKKVVKKNKLFFLALAFSLILGFVAGMVGMNILAGKDEFTLYNDGVAMKEATVTLQSGESYDVDADKNKTKVVVWGTDVSSYVKYTIKYINEESGEVETVTEFTKDGTYCIIYELDYSGNFFMQIGVTKYKNVKLRKTVIVGGNA